MKIINRDQFLQMPPGTIFCKYEPCVFDSIFIKSESIHDVDFFYTSLNDSIISEDAGGYIDESIYTGFKFDTESENRDGLYEKDQLFAVYEREDILQLISKLKESLL